MIYFSQSSVHTACYFACVGTECSALWMLGTFHVWLPITHPHVLPCASPPKRLWPLHNQFAYHPLIISYHPVPIHIDTITPKMFISIDYFWYPCQWFVLWLTQPQFPSLARFMPHQTLSERTLHVLSPHIWSRYNLPSMTTNYFITLAQMVYTFLDCSIQFKSFSTFLLLRKHPTINSAYPCSPYNLQCYVVLSFCTYHPTLLAPNGTWTYYYQHVWHWVMHALLHSVQYSLLHTFASYERKRLQLTAFHFVCGPELSRAQPISTDSYHHLYWHLLSAAASDLICIKQHIIIPVKRVALADCTATWRYWQGTLSPTPNRHFARIAQHKWPVRCRSRFLALENSSGSMWLAQKRSILMNTLCGWSTWRWLHRYTWAASRPHYHSCKVCTSSSGATIWGSRPAPALTNCYGLTVC